MGQTQRMIRLSVLYPKGEGTTFDHDYYRDKHIPLAVSVWGPEGAEIDRGVDGPFEAAVHFRFSSQDAVAAAMSNPRTSELLDDVKNYTNIEPVIQTSQIVG